MKITKIKLQSKLRKLRKERVWRGLSLFRDESLGVFALVMSGLRPAIRGEFVMLRQFGCGHVFGLLLRWLAAGPDGCPLGWIAPITVGKLAKLVQGV
jgi:hypothetical protein